MTRQQLQPYKSELRLVFNRVCALVEKRTAEVAAVKRERDDWRFVAQALFVALGIVVILAVAWAFA